MLPSGAKNNDASERDDDRSTQVTLAILAGGEGRRMGRPKGLLEVLGAPILEYIADRFQWPGPTLLVTAPGREHPPGWQKFAREVTDSVAGEGPLRGIVTALESAQTQRTIILPVDMPFMGREHLNWLARQDVVSGILLRRLRDVKPQIEPLPLLICRSTLEVLHARLKEGKLSVHALTSEAGFSVLDAPGEWEDRIWTNLNFPGDLPL